MGNDDILVINFYCKWETTSNLFGFVEIPLGDLYRSMKDLKKNQGFASFIEWFNILNCQKDENTHVIGKTKVFFIVFFSGFIGFLMNNWRLKSL